MAVRLSALCVGRPLPPGRFLVHFLLQAQSTQDHSAAGRNRWIDKSNYLIGNETRDLPASSIVPQPTTLPRVPSDAYRILVGKSEGKRQQSWPRRRWVENVKIGLREIGWGGTDWIDVAQDSDQCRAHVNTVMNLRVPLNVGKFLSSCTTGGFSRRAQFREVSLVS
jgi:hypothetical protein